MFIIEVEVGDVDVLGCIIYIYIVLHIEGAQSNVLKNKRTEKKGTLMEYKMEYNNKNNNTNS